MRSMRKIAPAVPPMTNRAELTILSPKGRSARMMLIDSRNAANPTAATTPWVAEGGRGSESKCTPYCERSEITITVRTPPTVTTTCIGNAPSGTADALKLFVSGTYFNQVGSDWPVSVVTRTLELPAPCATCSGRGKANPLPAVAISLGTDTVMTPVC